MAGPGYAANLSGLFTLPFNEGYGAAEYRRVISRQVNALPTFHTDDRLRLRDAQQRLILFRAARTAHRQFEDCARIDHAEIFTAGSAHAIAQYLRRFPN